MKVFVTGATSIIGIPLIQRLLEDGHRVTGIVRPGSMNIGKLKKFLVCPDFHLLELKMEDAANLVQIFSDECDVCFHLGWDGAGSENRKKRNVQQKNVMDSMVIFETMIAMNCKKFIFSGSQAEYGVHCKKTDEDAFCNPISEYGKAKIDFLNCVKAYYSKYANHVHMQYIHARIFSVYGPEEHKGSLIDSCIRTFLQSETIELGDCEQLWNFLYINDLIDAFLALMNAEFSNEHMSIYNIAGTESETMPLKEYIKIIYNCCGNHGNYILGKRKPNAEGTANLNPDITKIIKDTGWIPKIPFDRGICKVIEQRRNTNV